MFQRKYSLSKSRGVLKWCYQWYSRNWKHLSQEELAEVEGRMEKLQEAILQKDKGLASRLAKELEQWGHGRIKGSPVHYVKEVVIALAVALALATTVRMAWFEPYKIPTGSMRPTYKEEDHLLVSKTTYGINIPLVTDHFYFDPDKVIRGNPVIWSGDKLNIPNNDTKYFWIFPSKKRYIKRLIGKPGDTLYFYGGKIYGIDSQGNLITDLLDNPHMKGLEYIPFTSFEGKQTNVKPDQPGIAQQIVFSHFGIPVGRVNLNWAGRITGEVKTKNGWEKEGTGGVHYYDFFGMKNFAMARLLTPQQLKRFYPEITAKIKKAPLYLELRHHPTLPNRTLSYDEDRNRSLINTDVSILPVDKEHEQKLMDALYTARFDVVGGKARLYSESPYPINAYNPAFHGVKEGTYEFYHGIASQIGFKGIATKLPKSNPLYDLSRLPMLFNLGTNFSTVFSPHSPDPFYHPSRYAYYRNGDLYVMGSPIFTKNDPVLKHFIENEKKHPQGFVDAGPPSDATIRKYGLKIPKKEYLVLGDNHAMSGDSRSFGFVPEENLQGTPSFIFWPPGPRWGFPDQVSYPFFTISNIVVWSIALMGLLIWWLIHHRNLKKPIYKKLS